jgi:hypothetical protein
MSLLIERFGAKNLEILSEKAKTYPTLVKIIHDEMSKNDAYISLSYETICYLKDMFSLPDHSPVSIDSLFQSK